MRFPLKIQIIAAIFGYPLIFLVVTRAAQGPWLAALGAYLLGAIVVGARYEGFAYRVSILTLASRYALLLPIALVVALTFALVIGIDLADLFRERAH
jgi:hypothetical protein